MKTLVQGWDDGSFFPRLVEPGTDKEPSRCGYCSVAEACVRGDSGARRRVLRWESRAQEIGADGGELEEPFRNMLELWRLGAKKESK